MKYFLSQPMHGLTDEEIKKNTEEAEKLIKSIDPRLERFDSLWFPTEEDFPTGLKATGKRVFCLGRAIQKLSECDMIIFLGPCYDTSSGCAMEFEIAMEYDYPCYLLKDGELLKLK